ncbi:cobalamin biosynthesis protein CobD/CbiB [Alteromonas sp. CYL-A6]|uniref:cobalamin biosynthesis protein CobD/CbiB n=1 Tax=Alteromonas nitratireducens TaxID=3390813 RepID=UPI0034AAFD8B
MPAIFSHSAYQPLIVLLFAVALDVLWRWPASTHPMTLLRYLAQQMRKKVCPTPHDPPLQHTISGSLGAFMLIVPVVVTIGMLIYMAQYPFFFEALVMACVLDFHQVRYQYQLVLRTVGQDKKMLARERVSGLVARDCSRLTDIGIAKAAIEALLLKFYYLYCGVIFWFMVAGPVAALVYRMVLELAWQWNTRQPGLGRFGRPVRQLAIWTRTVPAFLAATLMLLVTSPLSGIRAARQANQKDTTSLLLALFAGSHGFRLGGPAYYADHKIRGLRVGGQRDVRYSDMIYSQRAIYRAMVLVVTISSLLLWLVAELSPPGG